MPLPRVGLFRRKVGRRKRSQNSVDQVADRRGIPAQCLALGRIHRVEHFERLRVVARGFEHLRVREADVDPLRGCQRSARNTAA